MRRKILSYVKKILIILFWLILSIAVVACIYVFYRSETEILQYKIINPFYEYVEKMPFWIYLVLYFTAFSLFSVFLFIALSIYFSIQRNRSSKAIDRYSKFFAFVLTNCYLSSIYQDDNFQKNLIKKLKPFVKKQIQLEALFRVYTKIQETLAMDLSDKFKRLLSNLNLYKKIDDFLFDEDFDNRILAMKVLSYLRIHDNEKQIIKYSDNKNFALRTEAYAALIRLMKNDEHLVKFIGNKHQLSVLDMNIIVNAVLKNFKLNIDYKGLLSSENPRKIMIGLMLTKYRYRINSRNLILILNHIGNADAMLNKLAWDALMTIVPENEVIEIIIDRFENEQEDVKLLILKKSHNIENQRFLTFLDKIIKNQPLLVKVEAMKILFENDFDALANYTNSQNEEIQKAYKETACVFINK